MQIFAILLGIALFCLTADPAHACEGKPGHKCGTESEEMAQPATLPVESDFGSRVVYTTDAAADAEPYRQDCEQRGGTFNECGSPCESSAEACIAVCAYTCENIK